jgi:hypothetical protein
MISNNDLQPFLTQCGRDIIDILTLVKILTSNNADMPDFGQTVTGK